MLMQSWLHEMLEQRNCPQPDRRWLYAYRLDLDEYFSLKAVLCDALQGSQVAAFVKRNRIFSALFVLYAAEWWRREYSGGAWRWSSILESLGIKSELLAPNERTDTVLTGFAYWGLRPTGEGKKYFGAIVAHGGLPLKMIGHGDGKFAAIMATVLRQAARYRWNEGQVADAVAEHALGLPESLCQREIYELVAQMVMTALRLKQEYRIEGTADPISALDQAYPDWRGEFPLALDDDAAQRLLVGLVREVNQTSLANELAAFSVIRVLVPIADGMYTLQSSIAHPSVLSAESLVAQFELASAEVLPRYFNIDVAVNDRVPLTVGRQILGTQNASVSLAAQRSKWVASDALNEHLLFLRDTTGDLHDGPVAIPGGESIYLDEPLVFADRDHMLRFVGSGNLRLPEAEGFLAISDDALIQDTDQGDSPLLIGRVDFSSCSLRVFRITTGAVVSQNGEEWHVTLNQTSKLASNYVLEGQRLPFHSRPWPVFKGMPKVARYSESGERALISSASQKLYVAGTDRTVKAIDARGLLDLIVIDGEEQLARLRFVVIDKRAEERFVSASVPTEGEIRLSGWHVNDIALARADEVNAQMSFDGDGVSIKLNAADAPPDQIRLAMKWPNSRYDVHVSLPFPATGGRVYDIDGNSIESGQTLALRRLAGTRVQIFDQNPNTPKRYEIVLSLLSTSSIGRQLELDLKIPIDLKKGVAEVRLLDLYPEIESLLGFSEELDASVKLTLLISDCPGLWLKIVRYDTLLEHHVMSVGLPQTYLRSRGPDELFSIQILATPLTIARPEHVTLTQVCSEGVPTGMWGIEELDAGLSPWLIFPGQNSAVQFRPLLFDGGIGTRGNSSDAEVARCALARAMLIPDQTLRSEAIAGAIDEMVLDFMHPSWPFLDQLWTSFGKLPLCSIDPFKILAARPDWVVAVLMRSQLKLPDLFNFVSQLKRQLGLVLELASISAWRDAINRLRKYWVQLVGEEAAKLTFNMIVKERLDGIAFEFQSLQVILDLLLFETAGGVGQSLIEIQRKSASDPATFSRELWSGADSTLMRYLLRTHADDRHWPEQRFFKEQALPALLDGLSDGIGTKLEPRMKSLFWVATNDFKMSVANAPVICAIWAVANVDLDWWLDSARRAALRRLRAFDVAWFEECYRKTLASCMAFGLLMPLTTAPHPTDSNSGGKPTIRRIPAGSRTVLRTSP